MATVLPDYEDSTSLLAALNSYRDWFKELPGDEAIYRTFLLLFASDGLFASQTSEIDKLQRRLKPNFVREGLMVGQFYPGCTESGLWNAEFRPLDAPVAMLAIRHMVPSDFPFLIGTRGDIEMLIAYFSRFATGLPRGVQRQLAALIYNRNTEGKPNA